MRADDVHAGPCPPAVDVTAYAHGELLAWRRAEIARHLLRCTACRDLHAGADDVFARLRALGDEGDAWRDDVALARRVAAARRRRTAVAAAVACVLVAGVAIPLGLRGGSPEDGGVPAFEPPPVAMRAAPDSATPRRPLAPAERALLAAQRDDGRWSGEASDGLLRHDEAATGLALFALASRRPAELREGEIGRATAAAITFLRSRQDEGGRIGRATPRDHAIATAALVEVYRATRDESLAPSVEQAVRALARAARDPDADDATARWTGFALARARTLGRDGLEAALGAAPSTAAVPSTLVAAAAPRGETPVANALRILART